MRRSNKEKTTGSKGFEPSMVQGLARCGGRGGAGVFTSLVGDLNKIATWNVRSLYVSGKLANVLSGMKRMGIDIMGVAETCWDGEGSFPAELPESEGGDKYKVFFSGGKQRRRGVGVIVREEVVKSVMMCEPISERIMIMRLKVAPINVLLVQIYAPNEDEDEEEKDRFYERLDKVIKEYRKGRECVIVMGDFNGKVGENREEDTIGPFGVGVRNDNGERVVNFCKRHNLFATNTWFQQRKSAQHTWISPDKVTKNQIDFVLVDKRFRNGILNSKSMPGADCDSDHNPVVVKMKIRLQRVKKAKKTVKWNVNNLKKSEVRNAYRMRLDQQLQEEQIDGCMEVDEIWKRLKDGISTVAEEICGKEMQPKKQNWMNSEILHKMEERRKCKNMRDEEQYKKLKQEIRKLCRQAKDKYYEDKWKENEMLDKAHSQLMYQKIKELRPKGNRGLETIRAKQGNALVEKDEVMERWAEYVEELYRDETRGEDDSIDKSQMESEVYTISSEEIEAVIRDLPKGKACGSDNISAELLQCMGERGVKIMTRLINKIYQSGFMPEDFRESIFVPIPKVSKAQECRLSDFRTIALISHASKVLLHVIKR